MRIYLAGPDVFLPNPQEHAEGLKAVCREFGLEGVFPLDAELKLDGLSSKHGQAHLIFNANVGLIRSCQAVLANMSPFRGPSTDVGTAWEMGFAHALKLPIVGYTTDPRSYPERVDQYREYDEVGVPFGDPAFVENFELHDNLMLDCSTFGVYSSFHEAAEFLGRSLRTHK